jgi:hypothetical protein
LGKAEAEARYVMHKSRPGVTPCGFIRDCRFPSSAAIIITGECRKGSAVLRKTRRVESAGPLGQLSRGMSYEIRDCQNGNATRLMNPTGVNRRPRLSSSGGSHL